MKRRNEARDLMYAIRHKREYYILDKIGQNEKE
jgi:hypothetical protein